MAFGGIKLSKFDEELKKIRANSKRPTTPILILIFVLIIGTSGYYYLWHDSDTSILDALYMTVITITTVGFREVKPLDDVGKVFTMIIGVTGIGSLFYVLSVWMENLFLLELHNYRGKKKMTKNINELKNHIILIGYGRVGKLAARELITARQDFVVIDDDFSDIDDISEFAKLLTITGDATADDTLLRAGVDRAKGMIVTSANPSTNVFIVLSSKVLNPNIFIVCRTDYDKDKEKLIRAGADRIVNPYSIGGVRLANLMINTNIIDFMETSFGKGEDNLGMENIRLPDNCTWFGKTFKELQIRQRAGASVLAVIRNEKPILNPAGDFKLIKGDQLVVLGTRDDLRKMENMAASE